MRSMAHAQRDRSCSVDLLDFLRAAVDPAFALDPDGTILFWNDAASELFGFGAQEAIGQNVDCLLRPSEWEGHFVVRVQTCTGGHSEGVIEYRDKEDSRILVSSRLMMFPHGELLQTCKDITESRKQENRLSILIEAAALLASGDVERKVEEFLACVQGKLPIDIYWQYDLEADCMEIACREGNASDALGPHVSSAKGISMAVVATGKPVLVGDIAGKYDARSAALAEMGFRSCACFPLAVAGRSFGTLAFASRTDRFSGEDLRFLQTVADYVAAAKERIRTEREARESEQRLRLIAESNPSFVWMSTPDSGTLFISPTWTEYTGLTQEETNVANLWKIVPEPDHALLIQELERVEREQCAFEMEFRLRSQHTGECRWFVARSVPQFDESGKVVARLGSATDIHDRKTEEERLRELVKVRTEELEQANADLIAANKELEGFTHTVSHDFRGPLRTIMGNSTMLIEDLGDSLDPSSRGLLERQVFNARKLNTLVDDLLQYARLSRAPIAKEPLDFSALSREVAIEVGQRGWGYACDFEIEDGLTACGDRKLIELVLTNLVENACKYSPGGANVEIGLIDGAFFVRDKGIGFDMAHVAKVFRPFERLVSDRDFPGSGVGMANVERIVHRHGGTIWVESELGKGTTFFFSLAEPAQG